ncbi:putative methyltransferase [Cupriavidus basilensis OR16]|uniref:Putative methyltransferase n=1 Tax=Cupriavidus basilensis OR16 TaxID=1127483 RepID=H1S9H8_9BURK|nr:class I SAM-dependent methyltransferase [Cupriavidus basilensis]EHP40902.1 putative methyltransferase [Cupriavidus basilensis OR16]
MSFGESAAIYNQTRQSYSTAVMDKVADILGAAGTQAILDIGCGTGIATRQLTARGFRPVGIDVDPDMIDEARLLGQAGAYQVMGADRLDFADAAFSGATAFGAFHWFSDDVSVRNIQRVLMPGAAFVVVNKNDASDFREVILGIVGRYVALSRARPKAEYQPAGTLCAGGFHAVREERIPTMESLSIEHAVAHVRSMHLWQEVPASLHGAIEADLRDYVGRHLDASGKFPRPLVMTVVSGCR